DEADIIGVRPALLAGWHTLVPFAVLVYFLVEGYTAAYVAGAAALTAIVVSWTRPGLRVTPGRFIEICVGTLYALGPLVAAVAAAGIVIGGLNITGLAGKVSSLIFSVTGGELLPTLIIAAAVTILLGMGMPVVAAYALVAVLVAPVLLELEIPLLQAHLFLVYYSVLSAITPPIAIACYVASSIAEESPMKIATSALGLGMVAFIVPFMFIYHPGLLLLGEWPVLLQATVTATIGVYFLCVAQQGWHRGFLVWWQRAVLIGAGIATIAPGVWTDAVGAAVGIGLLLLGGDRRRIA
ncbi:MAG: TRAP transporter large permease subunit, partial [Pseudomonadota bacterium]|nr:TRAP transporter large permease subunit [Pseudomonadota bacterium]